MDLCIFTGRATKDPVIRQGNNGIIASFAMAVDTGFGDNRKANFFNMVAFGKAAESVDRFIRQGTKIIVQSEAQQNVWEDKDGQKHYDVNFIIRSWEFAESKKADSDGGQGSQSNQAARPTQQAKTQTPPADDNGFVNIPDSIDADDVPFA